MKRFSLFRISQTFRKLQVLKTGGQLTSKSFQEEEVFCGKSFSSDSIVVQSHDSNHFTARLKRNRVSHSKRTEQFRRGFHNFFAPREIFFFEVDTSGVLLKISDQLGNALAGTLYFSCIS